MSDHAIEQFPHGAEVHHAMEEHHPGPSVYITVAVVLILLTAMEIGVFYAPFLQALLVPLLIILAILKFILVAMFYMHLHYDSRTFAWLFGLPLLLALSLIVAMMLLFIYLGRHSAT